MRQRKLGSHTPPCHRRMVITTLFSVLLAALQRRPVLYHTRWLLTVHRRGRGEGGGFNHKAKQEHSGILRSPTLSNVRKGIIDAIETQAVAMGGWAGPHTLHGWAGGPLGEY